MRGASYYDFHIRGKEDLLVYDDVRIQFYNGNKKAFHFWFNTFFVDKSGVFYINKWMIDGAHKDKKSIQYDKNFSIKVYMTTIENSRIGTWKNVQMKEFKMAALAKVPTKHLKNREEEFHG